MDLNIEKHDQEGRVITAEYPEFFLVSVYVPNAGDGLKRLQYRADEWDPDFRDYLNDLKRIKPVVLSGDLNVAHHPIDLWDAKGRETVAGFTPEERFNFTKLLETGFIDTFRYYYPSEAMYT